MPGRSVESRNNFPISFSVPVTGVTAQSDHVIREDPASRRLVNRSCHMLQKRPHLDRKTETTGRMKGPSCPRCSGAHAVLTRCCHPYQLGFATAAAIGYDHLLRGAAALLGAVPRTARRARVVLCAAILPARCVLGMAALRCTSVHGLAAIDLGAVVAAGASVWGISFRFGDSGVAAIREGASVSAAIISTATATAALQLGYPFRRQGGIDVIGRVLGNATQRSGRMREAPQKGGISVFPGGMGHCAYGRLLRATLARQADRRVLALADHTFTLERACDAGIGAARGLKRRLSMREASLAPRKSCQTWPAVLALVC